ncbi:SSPO protein, partial [Climacteris rufus]|nr:SSPO protein [Climacteris rufus]
VVAQGRNVSVNGAAVPEGRPYLHKGLGVTWPGDWVAVASSLGVRVAWDGQLAVTVTAEPELRGGTWGLCGTYTDDPAGERHPAGASPATCTPQMSPPSLSPLPDDLVLPDGDVAASAAAFGNAWKVP